MQNMDNILLGGWLFIILAIAVFFISIAGTLAYVHYKTKRLSMERAPLVTDGYQRVAMAYADADFEEVLSKFPSVSLEYEIESLGTETRKAIYGGLSASGFSRVHRIGMSNRENLESFKEMRYGQISTSHLGVSQTDAIGSAFFEGMPEGSWG